MPDDAEALLLAFVQARLVTRPKRLPTADTPLFEDRLLNSINILDLIGYVERVRGRRLEPRELVMDNFRNVRTIVERFLRAPLRG